MLVLGVPTTIASNWQLVRSGVRRLRPKRPASAVAAAPKDETEAREPTGVPPLPRYLPPSPRFRLRPDYRYNGGAVSTAAVVDVDGYMESVLNPPDTGDVLSVFAVSWPGPNGTGTAFTP